MQDENKILETEAHAVPKEVYFLGIAGIGMSALARYYVSKGALVSGYDKTSTALSKKLESEGMTIHYTDDVSLANISADLIVYTPAIPKGHTELNYFFHAGANIKKRSEVLGMITNGKFNICVAGTHGKTTTSAMVAHLLTHSGAGCNAFLGGIATNYDSNFLSSQKETCVVEADEFDRSFLQLSPSIAIITSMDADHLDIYGTAENMEDAFVQFAQKVKPGGKLIAKHGLHKLEVVQQASLLWYDLENRKADVYCKAIRIKDGAYELDIHLPDALIEHVELGMGGNHNIENMLAAVAVAHAVGISAEKIKAAVKDFKGVKRRFEKIISTEAVVLIDDYAHHPEELRTLIAGVKELYADRKLLVIFQPHLFSRTKDHAAGFAEVLSIPDETILLPIYPARELPIDGVTSEIIAANMSNDNRLIQKNEVLQFLKNKIVGAGDPLVVVVAGAGDIDTLVPEIKKLIDENK